MKIHSTLSKTIGICVIILFSVSVYIFSNYQKTGNRSILEKSKKNADHLNNAADLKSKIDLSGIPLYFIKNGGQMDSRVLFYARSHHYTLWITKTSLVFDSVREKTDPPGKNRSEENSPGIVAGSEFKRDVSRMVFQGAEKDPSVTVIKENKLKVNYFMGNDRRKWHSAPTSESIQYNDIYKSIDLKVMGIETGIEYDWIVRNGGDPADIQFRYENIVSSRINKAGDLEIRTGFGTLIHKKPVAWQETPVEAAGDPGGKGKKIPVQSGFRNIDKNCYGYFVGKYNKNYSLVIDPVVLAYSTYLGSDSVEKSFNVECDNRGNVIIAGDNWYGSDFPVTNDAYQTTAQTKIAFVTKIDTKLSGTASLIYSTFLGGNGNESTFGLAVDSHDNIYISGYTSSADFPVTSDAFQKNNAGGEDVFLAKLDPQAGGVSSLIYSTYLGGSGSETCYDLAVDQNGHAYLTGDLTSTDFPVKNAYQNTFGGALYDSYVAEVNPAQSGSGGLIYSTFLGGTGNDQAWAVSLDDQGYAYVTGFTNSMNFPLLNGFQDTFQGGGGDAFVSAFNTHENGSASLIYSTFLGGDDTDSGRGVAVDTNGDIIITGTTRSSNFPLADPYQSISPGIFLSRIDTSVSGSSALLYSTLIGGSGSDFVWDLALDTQDNAFLTGQTNSSDFPVTTDASQSARSGGFDAFVIQINTNVGGASGLLYSTYLGGSGDDRGNSIAVDTYGNFYVSGNTLSTNFPVIKAYQNTFQSSYNTYEDVFVSKFSQSFWVNGSVSGGHGSVSPPTQNINYGDPAVIDIFPDTGYEIASILDNGDSRSGKMSYMIPQVREDHIVEFTFKKQEFSIAVSVTGGNGTAVAERELVEYGSDTKVNFFPDPYFKIGSVKDNGQTVPVSNPYFIRNIRENHTIEVWFVPDAFPPVLLLTGSRHRDQAWIIEKEYSELNISIEEHPVNPIEVSAYTLFKMKNGAWEAIQSYSASGTFQYIDKSIKKGESATYILKGIAPDRTIVAETSVLQL